MATLTRYGLAVFLALTLGAASGCGGGEDEKGGAQGGGNPAAAGGNRSGGGKAPTLSRPDKAKMGRPDLGGNCPQGGCPGRTGSLSSGKKAPVSLGGDDTAGEGEFIKATRSPIAAEARKRLAALKTDSLENAGVAAQPQEIDPSLGTDQAQPNSGGQEQAAVHVCPMKDYSGPMTPNGLCPKCGMALPKEVGTPKEVESVDPTSAKAPQ